MSDLTRILQTLLGNSDFQSLLASSNLDDELLSRVLGELGAQGLNLNADQLRGIIGMVSSGQVGPQSLLNVADASGLDEVLRGLLGGQGDLGGWLGGLLGGDSAPQASGSDNPLSDLLGGAGADALSDLLKPR